MDPAARAQRLSQLIELSTRIGSQLELETLLQTVVDFAREFSQAELCGLLVLSEKDPTQFSGIWVSGWELPPRHYPTGAGVFNLPLVTGKPLRVDHVPAHEKSVGVPEGHPPIGPFLGVPMWVKDRILGTLFVANLVGGTPFSEEDEELLVVFAAQASVAIHNSLVYSQAEELTLLRERERMAINLHDTVAQIFFSIGLELGDLVGSLPPGPLAEKLEYVRNLAAAGSDRVREAIGSLYDRGGLPDGANLHRELIALADEFQREHSLPVGLVVSGPVDQIDPAVAEVFSRAAREGLTNVRKHARATMAVLSLVVHEQWVTLSLQDNGSGLAPGVLQEVPNLRRFGLVAIRRQIERLGGRLEITDGDEGGALLRLTAPISGAPASAQARGGGR